MLTYFEERIVVLLLAASLDYIIGDPKDWIHPVQVMGWIIAGFRQACPQLAKEKWQRRTAGIIVRFVLGEVAG